MAKRSFKCFVEQELGKFPFFLIYAVLEWVLIIVLFIDGFLAFLANEFAKFFEMKIPCLLCTRIDHVLVCKDADFYYNESICETHKKEASSLAYCHVHKKLSDVKNMCEACLLSFATEKESDCDTYKSLVGILHKDIDLFVDDDRDIYSSIPAGTKDNMVALTEKSSSLHHCSCCKEPLKENKSYSKGKNYIAASLSQVPAPSPSPSPRGPFVTTLRNEGPRKLAHVRYTELQDDEDFSNTSHPVRQDSKTAMVPLLSESENMNEDGSTPTVFRGNRFFGIPLTDSPSASPRAVGASPRGFSRFSRKPSFQRTESSLYRTEYASESSIEGVMNSNEAADGDLILHHLKKQVRLDRKSLMALYMELDEERSASAVAANNAMAMITRLQAEKAAVQMEALQYQRLMDEQAEYDQEALQATRDLVSKREEEIKVLEAEVAAYRRKFGVLTEADFIGSGDENSEDYQEINSESHSSYIERYECSSPTFSLTEGQSNAENAHDEHQSSPFLVNEIGNETKRKSPDAFRDGKSRRLSRLKNLENHANYFSQDAGAPPLSQSSASDEEESKPNLMEEGDGGFINLAGQAFQNGSEVLTGISDNLVMICDFMTGDDHED